MNDTLKVAGRIGAELGAAKAENEKLREVLSRIANLPMYQCSSENDYRLSAAKAMAVDALSQQAEPTDTYTAVDMATAAAQGFRDGQAAVEPVPAQDERKAFKRALHSQRVFKLSSATINAAEWAWFARPAQTEQQPVGRVFTDEERFRSDGKSGPVWWFGPLPAGAMLYAAPIAQTAPQVPAGWKLVPVEPTGAMRVAGARDCSSLIQPDQAAEVWTAMLAHVLTPTLEQTAPQPEQSGKFSMGDRVKKSSGSEWVGHVCGWYSTNQTPEGYAVESEAHAGSVQIYPAKALETVE